MTKLLTQLQANFYFLEAQDSEKDIYFYINSPGGSVTAGFAIYDTMQHIKCDVVTILYGYGCKYGSILISGRNYR